MWCSNISYSAYEDKPPLRACGCVLESKCLAGGQLPASQHSMHPMFCLSLLLNVLDLASPTPLALAGLSSAPPPSPAQPCLA